MDKENAAYICHMIYNDYYSAIKILKKEILPFSIIWTDLEDIVLSEISQTNTV